MCRNPDLINMDRVQENLNDEIKLNVFSYLYSRRFSIIVYDIYCSLSVFCSDLTGFSAVEYTLWLGRDLINKIPDQGFDLMTRLVMKPVEGSVSETQTYLLPLLSALLCSVHQPHPNRKYPKQTAHKCFKTSKQDFF